MVEMGSRQGSGPAGGGFPGDVHARAGGNAGIPVYGHQVSQSNIKSWRSRSPNLQRVRAARRRGAAAVLALCLIAGLARLAAAHASLVRSVPEDGAVLEEPPSRVELVFSEPVEASFSELTLERAGGETVELGDLEVEGETVRAEVVGDVQPGDYVLRYREVSADGHPVEGELSFRVASAGPASSPDNQPSGGQPGSSGQGTLGGDGDAPAGDEGNAPAADERGAPGRGSPWPWVLGLAVLVAAGTAIIFRRRR